MVDVGTAMLCILLHDFEIWMSFLAQKETYSKSPKLPQVPMVTPGGFFGGKRVLARAIARDLGKVAKRRGADPANFGDTMG